MRSNSVLLVDAGYLLAAAATRLTGSSFRRGISMNYEKLISELIAMVEASGDLPLLRVYWYDAGKNGVADQDQERIAALPKVKLRLGRVGVEGEQKGVDLRIGLDMISQSRNGAVDTIYLLSGDDDLTEAVEEAQALGVRVIVLAVPTAQGSAHGVSRYLVRAADGVEILDASVVDTSATPAVIPATVAAIADTKGPTPVATTPRPMTPADVARRTQAATAPSPTFAYSGSSGSTPAYIAPDYQRDPAEIKDVIVEVVGKTYSAWCSTAAATQRDDLRAGRPTIPRDLDRALLVDLSDALGDYYLNDNIRVELRSQFWEAVEASLQKAF